MTDPLRRVSQEFRRTTGVDVRRSTTVSMTTAAAASIISSNQVKKREIHASCFQLLYMQMVEYIINSSQDRTEIIDKLNTLGFQVGQRLAERYTKDQPRFKRHLEMIKFICKDFWMEIYKKPIDNLKTNHQGVYRFTDKDFRWLKNFTSEELANYYASFSCGIVRGALNNLGIANCNVEADVSQLPICIFTIKITNKS
eukprot:TRINITY_DN8368_c0_g1_i3.p1 TRINITY_DN8368_c0_g1~~TRINITY_DN8368_c0_g1_i3.p1  ORF type:complete len:198 (-),score=35.17 TRINITY_DN8368_c0_g1_i3:2-595(-)